MAIKAEQKKWMVPLRMEQWEWIKETIAETGIKGSDIIRAIIDEARNSNSKSFRGNLKQAQVKIKLQKLVDRKAQLEAEESELIRQLKEPSKQLQTA